MTPVMQRPCVCPRCGVGHSGVKFEPPAETHELLADSEWLRREHLNFDNPGSIRDRLGEIGFRIAMIFKKVE
jgi:hypothetical protein